MLDENQVGDGNLVVRIDIASQRAESAIGHAHSNAGHVLERIRHGQQEDLQFTFSRANCSSMHAAKPDSPAQCASSGRPERWSLAFKNPHMSVGRLLAEQRRECA